MSDIYLNQEDFENVFKNHIKSGVYSLSIKTLFGNRMSRKINYQPYYQRNYVWDNRKATFFIESILLGTDIPPLIFFNTGSGIEVIDGRQRYETIMKFRNGDFKLNIKGLTKLMQLQNYTFSKLSPEIQAIFDDAKIRIFEFEVFNEPRMDPTLEDKIKKEIFRRYNSGITPLNSAEIDNATYDDDHITNKLKLIISNESALSVSIREKFIGRVSSQDPSRILQFFRRYLVLSSFPIKTFATGSNRTEIMDLLYSVKSNITEDVNELCNTLVDNIKATLNLISMLDIKDNRLINECLLWAMFILLENEVDISSLHSDTNIAEINLYLKNNTQDFSAEKSHHYRSIITRHKSISRLFTRLFNFDFSLYISKENFKNEIKEMRQSEKEAKLKLDELASLRVQKPEPSIIPIEEIASELGSNKFLIRPSYQRQEKINLYKASAIIESIILGINLPPLFIFKKKSGVKEVIDGQQRLLSIIGFLGKPYLDENSRSIYPKNVNFKLKRLKILKEHNGKRYSDLEFSIQEKILDFKISIIEIDEALNENFEPVDLFIRLNNKPYPIKENSFEMWNSFMDKEIIQTIRKLTDKNIDWFFIKQRNNGKSSDRMLNEELVTLLCYICYNSKFRQDYTSIGFYRRDNKINCRITDKKDVSALLEKTSTDIELKVDLINCIEEIQTHIEALRDKLNSDDPKLSLNELLSKDSSRRYLVDFYILFQIMQRLGIDRLKEVSYDELQSKMVRIKQEINSPSNLDAGDSQQVYFEKLLDEVSN